MYVWYLICFSFYGLYNMLHASELASRMLVIGDANFLFHVILILVSVCLCLRHVALARI